MGLRKCFLSLLVSVFFVFSATAQLAKTQVVRVSAIANANGSVTLTWPAETYAGTFDIYKRLDRTNESWGATFFASVPGNKNTYTDTTTKEGDAFEYRVVKANAGTPEAFGYIYAGNKLAENTQQGGIILLVDSNFITALNGEITRLENDLKGESWIVYTVLAGRSESVPSIKNRILNTYNKASIKPSSIFIIGHVPVPYAGFYSANGAAPPPDGHVEGSGNHTGAWPADVYYGILEDVFTDNTVDCNTGTLIRNHNAIGDGKFDQTKLPAKASLEIGRLDLFDMPAFGKSDTLLTKNYLNRNHAWRTGQWRVKERALIDNNFTSLNLASTGYANFSAMVSTDSIFDNRDYFTAQKAGSYLWSYGCGAGSFTTCAGIGNTNNFVNDSFENVFTILAGSFFGDWDAQNNFLKAPLASKSLASFWGGIPKWYVHHMGLGERIGVGTKISQNNVNFYFSGNFNSAANSMHIALMGDPTLRMRNLPGLSELTAISENKTVKLSWTDLNDPDMGYAVYRVNTTNNHYERLNPYPLYTNSFIDYTNYYSGDYLYAVKPIALETTASGSYYNTGAAAFAWVSHVNGITNLAASKIVVSAYPNPLQPDQTLKIVLENSPSKNVLIELLDINGKQVFEKEYENKPGSKNEFEIGSNQLPGIYILKLQAEEEIAFIKVILQ